MQDGARGTLDHCASVWDYQNNSITVGAGYPGPKIINFAPILKYDYFPLARTLDVLLDIIKSSLGMPVEIEFAVNLNREKNGKPGLYILQISTLPGNLEEYNLDPDDIDRKDLFLHTEKAMGNGTITDLSDIVYVDLPRFDRGKTVEMTEELDRLNTIMKDKKRRYILIGPGRWGSRDRWLGILVRWADISNARIVVEIELEDFHIDASLGSHFFHNITSKNIGYFYVPHGSEKNFIDWDWLKNQPLADRTEHFIHVQLERPMTAKMDGRKSVSVIYKV